MTSTRRPTAQATCLVALLILSLNGCNDLDEALNAEPRRRVVSVPGIASTSDIEDVQNATGGNAPTSPDPRPAQQPTPQPTPQPTQPTTSAVPATGAAARPSGSSIIGKMTAEVIDYKKYRSNPFIVVVENKIQGSDPLTVAATAYVVARSRASSLNFKRQLDIIKAGNGRAATYEEFQKLQKQLRIELAQLPRYQAYAYDETTGGLLVIENKKYKIQLYRKAGIPIEADDKVYEQKLKSLKSQQPGNR